MLGLVAQLFVHQPTMAAAAPGRQAQDIVTMAMWQMMSSMVQQQQHMACHGVGSGTPRTGFPQPAGTPIGNQTIGLEDS